MSQFALGVIAGGLVTFAMVLGLGGHYIGAAACGVLSGGALAVSWSQHKREQLWRRLSD